LGLNITATATDPQGNTSEFSSAVTNDPTASISGASASVGATATTEVFTVTLSEISSVPVTIAYNTADVTAIVGVDYIGVTNGLLTINPGSLTGTITISIAANLNPGSTKSFDVVLSDPANVVLSSNIGIGTILNTNQAGVLAFAVANEVVVANDGRATITVDRTGGSSNEVTVAYTTSDGTGHAGTDYSSTSGTLTFGPGVTIQTITVPILNNTLATGPVTVNLALSSPTSFAALGSQSATTLTINPVPLAFESIIVQKGSVSRSYVRYLDINFNTAAGIQSVINSVGSTSPQIKLTFLGLDGTSNVNVPIVAGEMSIMNGKTLRLDFGRAGITGNASTNAGDGYYQISVAPIANGSFTSMVFDRLLGDVTGDGRVNASDLVLVSGEVGLSGTNLQGDVNGDGVVNTVDRLIVAQAQGRKLSGTLHLAN
jgi:hypothetical protein